MKIKLHHITLLSGLILFFNCYKDSTLEEEPIAKKATASIAATINLKPFLNITSIKRTENHKNFRRKNSRRKIH
ncbi:hypothetical protein [Mariniflexile sp.]|uniref:hypothetical protein n=1 Tax=Mariniflexile sp. TaxID=1979402 RepID=UPI00404781EC